ncbi:MAG: hypothetical protein K0S41_600 [Anaerocolumna sp.]|jgi:hypothetical protein|nr:hypothetical protein [Anaerocolumna sp.]
MKKNKIELMDIEFYEIYTEVLVRYEINHHISPQNMTNKFLKYNILKALYTYYQNTKSNIIEEYYDIVINILNE